VGDLEKFKGLKKLLTGKPVKVYIRGRDPTPFVCKTGIVAYFTTIPPYILVLKDPNDDKIYVINWKEVAWVEAP